MSRASNEGSRRFHNHGQDLLLLVLTHLRIIYEDTMLNRCLNKVSLAQCLNSVLNVKVLKGPFYQGPSL